MSNIDEIIKLKELLDNNIITQEEFEKKKTELLNQDTKITENINKSSNVSKQTIKPKGKMSVGKGILIIFIVLFLSGILISQMNKTTLKDTLEKKIGMSEAQALTANNILEDCGISYGILNRDSQYDNFDIENSKGYTIDISYKNCKVLMALLNNEIYSLKMLEINNETVEDDKYLYKEKAKVAKLTDYTTTKTTNTYETIPQENFTLVSSSGTNDSYGYLTITGEIKNNTNRTYSYAQVTFNIYDESGAQVGTAMDNINNFEANGTWHFKALAFTNGKNYKLTGITGW